MPRESIDDETDALVYIVDPEKESRMYPGDWEKVPVKEAEQFDDLTMLSFEYKGCKENG